MMPLKTADWHEVLTVLRETVRIWSPGLTPHDYRRYIWLQMHHHWGRSNYRFYVYKEDDEVKSSCKLYKVRITARGKEYVYCGIGAVHTLDRHRRKNYARFLIEEVLELCEREAMDGVMLFSDIGPDLYEEFGFVEIGSAEFSVHLGLPLDEPLTSFQSSANFKYQGFTSLPLKEADLGWLIRHHRRWLRNQPFGIVRDEAYWRYKIAREDFLNVHSILSWPQLQLTTFLGADQPHGYAITESGGTTMRILEVIGNYEARMQLWRHLFEAAAAKRHTRIRGWESVIRDFEPNYKFSEFLESVYDHENVVSKPTLKISEMHYTERDWGRCMMLPINPETYDWLDVNPCPLLELDHL